MKIAIISSTFPPYEAGIGNAAYYQADGLARMGHEVTVFTPQSPDIFCGNQLFKIIYIHPIVSIGNASIVPELANFLKPFDVLHLHYPYFGGDIFVRKAANKFHKPYIITYHQDTASGSCAKNCIFNWYFGIFEKSIFKDAFAVIGLSEEHKEHSKLKNLQKYIHNLFIISNGVDTDLFSPLIKKRTIANIPQDEVKALFIAAIDKQHDYKRLDLLLEALSLLKRKMHLIVVGGGEAIDRYKSQVDRLGIKQYIHFLGKIENFQLASVINASSFIVMPSDRESFGIVILESFACEKPVLVSDIPSVKALVEENVNGFIFKRGDVRSLAKKLEYIQTDVSKLQQMGRMGRNMAEKQFSWQQVCSQLDRVYSMAISK